MKKKVSANSVNLLAKYSQQTAAILMPFDPGTVDRSTSWQTETKRWYCSEARVARWYIFKPKTPNLGKFWSALQWKMLV
jgi:hypothetical protein